MIKNTIFDNGSLWLRADFHLHTKADKEWKKEESSDPQFVQKYIAKLKEAQISIGVITNHNKFDKDEFKKLTKAAEEEDIWLIAGLEFSLKEGLHLLIAFEDEWYMGQVDNINEFIKHAFFSQQNYDIPPYPNSSLTLEKTVEALDKIGLDYFLVLAHVDDNNGLFEVYKKRNIDDFINDFAFEKVLAIQKSGNLKNYERLCKESGREIACVEGTDNAQAGFKAITDNERKTFVKIGDFNFEALKFALIENKNRVSKKEKPEINNPFIKSIFITGGLLGGIKMEFSRELNSLIGIRGSGKSSVLEILRYTLGIPLENNTGDKEYKNNLIEYVLRAGAKVVLTVVDKYKKEYSIEKIYGQKEDIYSNNRKIDIPSISTVINKPIYFGQKDLSNKNVDFEADLIKKLIGNKLDDVQKEIRQKSSEVKDAINSLKKYEDLEENRQEAVSIIKDAKYKLDQFREKKVDDKLKRQSEFDLDISRYKKNVSEIDEFRIALSELINNYDLFFTESKFSSEANKDIFCEADIIYKSITAEFEKIKISEEKITNQIVKLDEVYKKLLQLKNKLKEEFAEIQREISISDINPDEFLELKRKIDSSTLLLLEIEKSENKREEQNKILESKIAELNNLWHSEFVILEKEVNRINDYESSLTIAVEFKGRKDNFKEKLKQILRGTGIRDTVCESISNEYKDFIEIYKDYSPLKVNMGIKDNQIIEIKNRIDENLEDLLTYRVEDKFTINYNGKPLKDHSLGQRATALILFLLAQKEADILIIDQPEDDLDNQTIYEEVIKKIRSLKGSMQFIFATHNANIPVLGDSEKVILCNYSDGKMNIQTGTIDDPGIQKRIIAVMEGGEEAFNKRNSIYNNWKRKGK